MRSTPAGFHARVWGGTPAPSPPSAPASSALAETFVGVLRSVLQDLYAGGDATAQEKRWRAVLGAATWPEVLRRLVLTWLHEQGSHPHVDDHAAVAASMLSFQGFEALTPEHRLALLHWAVDALLETDCLAATLQRALGGGSNGE